MKSYDRLQCEAMLSAAANCELGGIVRSSDANRAKALLYQFRKEWGNPEHAALQIRFSPTNPDTELWIIKSPEPETEPEQPDLSI